MNVRNIRPSPMKFHIDIVSDTICPWCYIGWRNLKAAIEQRLAKNPNDTFSITWRAFQLNPNAPKDRTVDKEESYKAKLGIVGAENAQQRIRSAAERAGINLSPRGRTGNTLDSHRLLELARLRANYATPSRKQTFLYSGVFDLQTRLAEELFADYFEHEQDITSHEVLIKAAKRAGFAASDEEILRFLAGNELADEVRKASDAARKEQLNGVPHFTINDEFTVEGAQEPVAFLHLFERLAKKSKPKKAVL